MKKILLSLSITLLSFSAFSQDEVVNIPDSNFLTALIERGIDTNKDGRIQNSEAENVELLILRNKSINDLTGIKSFINLTELDCSSNILKELDVSNLSEFEEFYCYFNQLTNLKVNNLPNLTVLYCDSNLLQNIDVSTLSKLTLLSCSSNQLSTLNVSALTNLIYIVFQPL